MSRVVITGVGAITPIGNSADIFWASLLSGVSGAGLITKFDTSKFKTRFACEVKNFDPSGILEKADIRKYDAFTQFAMAATQEAVANAAIDFDKMNKDRIGVIWASGDGGVDTFESQVAEYYTGDGAPRFSPFFVPKRIINIAAGVISIKYGLRGVNYTTASACSASNTAIIDAFNYIKWGKADMIITGGSEASISPTSIGGFNAARAMSVNNEEFASASRPFDVSRDGFVLGEGAGALILERYDKAIERGAPILAEIVGGGLAADAYHLTGAHPEGLGALLGMRLALEDAGIEPGLIDYVNAHATSTPTGDPSELKAMRKLFNRNVSVSGTKSMTGHLLGAAGAIEAIACVLAVKNDMVPPTINTVNIEAEFVGDFDFVLGRPKNKTINYAMSNTFGFGGHIASSIYKKFDEKY